MVTKKTKKTKFGFRQNYVGDTLAFSAMLGKLPPIDLNDPYAVEERVNQYFDMCIKADCPPSVEGLALVLNMSRKQFLELVAADIQNDSLSIMRKSLAVLEHNTMTAARLGIMTPIMAIYDTANNHGYSRQGDVVINKTVIEQKQDPAMIAQKYAGLIETKEETE